MAEQVTEIQQVAYSPELTWNTERTITADAGDSSSYTYFGSFVGLADSAFNKFQGAMFLCTTGSGSNDGLWRQCEGFEPTDIPSGITGDTAFFQNDVWAADPSADTFKAYFLPVQVENGSLSREDIFGDRSKYPRANPTKKMANPYIRTQCGISVPFEVQGMGYKAGYGEVEASPSPTSSTFKVTGAYTSNLFQVGQSINIDNGTDGEVRRTISAISSADVITITPAMTSAPSTGDSVFGLSAPNQLGALLAGSVGSVLQSGRGDEVVSDPTTTGAIVNDGTQFAEGGIIGVTTSAGIQWTQITDVSSNVLTWSPALSTAPSTGGIIYNSWTVQPAAKNLESFTFTCYEDSIKRVLTGVRGTIKFENIESDNLARMVFEGISGGNEVATDESIPSDWCDARDDFDPPVPVGAYLQIAPSTAIATSEEFANLSFEQGVSVSRRLSPAASDGIANASPSGWESATMTLQINKTALSSFNPRTALEARTLQHVRLIYGGTPGKTLIIDFKQAQLVSIGDSENDSRDYYELTFEAKDTCANDLPSYVIALA